MADIEVELKLLPTDHGGRKGCVCSGYRPQFYSKLGGPREPTNPNAHRTAVAASDWKFKVTVPPQPVTGVFGGGGPARTFSTFEAAADSNSKVLVNFARTPAMVLSMASFCATFAWARSWNLPPIGTGLTSAAAAFAAPELVCSHSPDGKSPPPISLPGRLRLIIRRQVSPFPDREAVRPQEPR